MIHSERIVILYDSITNSVFISQVMVPITQWLSGDKKRKVTILSFEAIDTTNHPARAYIAREQRITLVIYKRLPFFGLPTLWYAAYRIRQLVKNKKDARVIARGQCAGYACLRARIQNPLLIQIRGLLWHEYEYTHKQQQHNHDQAGKTHRSAATRTNRPLGNIITNAQDCVLVEPPLTQYCKKSNGVPGKLKVARSRITSTRWLCHMPYKPCPPMRTHTPYEWLRTLCAGMRAKMLHTPHEWYYKLKLSFYKQLEAALYEHNTLSAVQFEAVSPALRQHLIATYSRLNPAIVTLAYDDIPQPIEQHQRKLWRKQTRAELGIPSDAFVYCYNGSAKPWQCPDDFFIFCRNEIAPNTTAHLLILSQDYASFKQILPETGIPKARCHLVSVEHDAIYRFMAAADKGLVFRQASLLNWVSRPTKLLEYQAVGLPIIHNGTIAWLDESARNQQRYNAPSVQ